MPQMGLESRPPRRCSPQVIRASLTGIGLPVSVTRPIDAAGSKGHVGLQARRRCATALIIHQLAERRRFEAVDIPFARGRLRQEMFGDIQGRYRFSRCEPPVRDDVIQGAAQHGKGGRVGRGGVELHVKCPSSHGRYCEIGSPLPVLAKSQFIQAVRRMLSSLGLDGLSARAGGL
ncbi:MAG: hypothetical protein JWP84_2121, partial [Tardiphaga sp.]|nr:hypothetical protein [Tardiphaga sp.]